MTNQEYKGIRGVPKSYTGIHGRLILEYGNAPLCIWNELHAARPEWANVTGDYTLDLQGYLPVCASCHRKFDYTESMRSKISKRSKGDKYASKGLVFSSDGQRYSDLYDAERSTGILHTSIVNCLASRSKTAGGLSWTRSEY